MYDMCVCSYICVVAGVKRRGQCVVFSTFVHFLSRLLGAELDVHYIVGWFV